MNETSTLRAVVTGLLALIVLTAGARAQTITAREVGGGCGGTVGYPALTPTGWLAFRVQRGVCDPNAVALPSAIAVGVRSTQLPIPFAPGFAPGCVWRVVPLVMVPLAGTVGGQGQAVFLLDVATAPLPLTIQIQALSTCLVQGMRETAASGAWEVVFR